jgi:hypothetical protein
MVWRSKQDEWSPRSLTSDHLGGGGERPEDLLTESETVQQNQLTTTMYTTLDYCGSDNAPPFELVHLLLLIFR